MNSTKRKTRLAFKLVDRLLLLITAMGLGFAIFFFIGFLNSKAISREWILFIWGCIIYFISAVYATLKTIPIKGYQQKNIYLLLLSSIILVSLSGIFLIFYFRFMPLPSHLLPYMIGSIFWAIISINFFKYCLKLVKRR